MNHPGQSFYVREITRLIEEQINSVRRELSNMLEVGVITSDTSDNKLYYQVNQRYEFYPALRAIFGGEPIAAEQTGTTNADGALERHIAIIGEIPSLRLAVLSGVLVKGSTSPIDVLLVGNASSQKVKAAISMVEKLEGREINYTVLPYDEFYYRLSVRDKFITEVLSGKHSVAVDKDNVLGEQ
jgi:hypothetical protein